MITWIGHSVLSQVKEFWAIITLSLGVVSATLGQILSGRFRFRLTVDQIFRMGVESLPIVVLALTFISLMLVIEFSFHMKLVIHEDSLVPAFSTVLMIRELGPVVTCMLLASRVGASIAAELGTMKLTDQIDALRLLSVDPLGFLVVPRWVACVLAAICLSVVSVAVAVLAGAYLAAERLHYLPSQFLNTMFAFTHGTDLVACLVKGAVFGSIIPIVASYQGFGCRPGAEGVGSAATGAVVQSFVLIIIADFFLTYGFYSL
jgi:phospholipid/cholesterol/gamma-HCH transport system permease protein